MVKTGHLFSGAGGGLLSDRILGHEPVFAVEHDRHCCRILRERSADGWFPGLHVHEQDIRLFDPSQYAGRVDCIHAGFPCQNMSAAGNGEGVKGSQSGLWSEVVRIAGILRPRQLFLENSPEIVHRGLDIVLSDLAALGYDAKWLCLSASRVGAPHERDRWWCLADVNSKRQSDGALDDETSSMQAVDIANTENAELSGALERSREEESAGFTDTDWWKTEPSLGRVVHVLANRVHRSDRMQRIKMLGNGQVPLQAALAYRLLNG